MLKAKTCPKCAGRMAEGVLLTKDSNGANCRTQWLEGSGETSMISGLKTKGLKVFPLVSYRCERCGLCETYAEG